MVKNCQLEDEKIQRMSTNELFNVVMAYPLLIDVFLYDDIDQGIKSVSQQYNGLRELLKRDDLQDVLYHKYLTYSKTEDVIDYNIYTANSIQKAITDNHISKRNIYIDFLNDKIPQIEKSMLDNYKYTDKERQKIINKQELLNDQQNAITFAAARADETVIVKTPKGSKIKCKRKASNKKIVQKMWPSKNLHTHVQRMFLQGILRIIVMHMHGQEDKTYGCNLQCCMCQMAVIKPLRDAQSLMDK